MVSNDLNQLTIPDTATKLVDGDIVLIASYSGVKWVVRNGWYPYCGQQFMGWYFCSIPDQKILPVNESDLVLVTKLSSSPSSPHNCIGHRPGHMPPPPPPPPPPSNEEFTLERSVELSRAWLSVPTISARDQLNTKLLPDGKVVRVNRMPNTHEPAYFVWDEACGEWVVFELGSAPAGDENFITEDELKEALDKVQCPSLTWGTFESENTSNESN